jgi:hypothetical protein
MGKVEESKMNRESHAKNRELQFFIINYELIGIIAL